MIETKFTQIESYFGYGGSRGGSGSKNSDESANQDWRSLAEVDLLIFVGVTGVGKSRTIAELADAGLAFTLLPNRRLLTDHLIIGALQRLDGESERGKLGSQVSEHGESEHGESEHGEKLPVVRDRKERFAYTRRYRDTYAGGMAHALSKLFVSTEAEAGLLIFDGLRGVNEVAYAAHHLPRARFVALCAPDGVRIERLLGRNDAFDQIDSSSAGETVAEPGSSSLIQRFPDAANVHITDSEEKRLLSLLDQQRVTAEEMAAKLAIVSEERRNYDPDATLGALQANAPSRLCIVDTVENGPADCAAAIREWLK